MRIRRSGFPVRIPHGELATEYPELHTPKSRASVCAKDVCGAICDAHLPEDGWQLGTSLLFLRDGMTDRLREAVTEYYARYALKLQGRVRVWRARARREHLRYD